MPPEIDLATHIELPAGADGPAEADTLLAGNGHRWRPIAGNLGACHA